MIEHETNVFQAVGRIVRWGAQNGRLGQTLTIKGHQQCEWRGSTESPEAATKASTDKNGVLRWIDLVKQSIPRKMDKQTAKV